MLSTLPDVPDGNYLYNPQTGKIEIQWVHGIGSDKAAAPQARLMATVINGILTRKLPWGLILLGVFLGGCSGVAGDPLSVLRCGLLHPHGNHARHLLRWSSALAGGKIGR